MDLTHSAARPWGLKAAFGNLASLLLIAYGFVLPMWVAPTYIIAGLVTLFWIFKGEYWHDFDKVRSNRVVWAFLAYLSLHVVGLLWTSDFESARHTLARAALYLFVPVFMTVLKREHVDAVLWGFLGSMLWSSLLSFLMHFHVDLSFIGVSGAAEPIPFMSHIHYSPYLTVAIAILLYYLLFDSNAGLIKKTLAAAMIALFTVNLFVSNGRAGQVMFFVMVSVAVIQFNRERLYRAVLILLIGLPMLFVLAYSTFPQFKQRVQQSSAEIELYRRGQYSSIGARAVYAENGMDVFYEHPFIGVGTGDFTDELKEIHERKMPDYPFNVDVHNSYVLKMGQFGVLGLIALLGIFYAQIGFSIRSAASFQQYLGLAVPLMFATIMMSDVYIEAHSSTMLLVFLCAVVYRESPEGNAGR